MQAGQGRAGHYNRLKSRAGLYGPGTSQKEASAIPVEKHQARALSSAGQLCAATNPCVNYTDRTPEALP